MTDSKIFDKIEMSKFPRYTREIYRYNQLVANIAFYPLDHEHQEIEVQSFLPKGKLSIVLVDENRTTQQLIEV